MASSHHTGDESYTGLNSHLGPDVEAILLVRGRHCTIGTVDTPPIALSAFRKSARSHGLTGCKAAQP